MYQCYLDEATPFPGGERRAIAADGASKTAPDPPDARRAGNGGRRNGGPGVGAGRRAVWAVDWHRIALRSAADLDRSGLTVPLLSRPNSG
jgi:hypothetical protein